MGPLTMSGAAAIGAVDIGGTKIAVGVVDLEGRLLASTEVPTAAAAGFDAAMARVAALLDAARAEARVALCGIGIGCTGPVDPVGGAIGEVEFLRGWEDCNPVAWLNHRFGVPVAMENDADASTLAESRWGAGRGKRSVIAVTIGTGIGAGIVLDGELYRGARGAHPELGHHVIDADGPQCFCGAHGCWEVLARGPAMVGRFERELPGHDARRAGLTAKRICELARSGDVAAVCEAEREGRWLGIGVANLVTLFAPEVIVLGGSVMKADDLFMPFIRATVRRHCGLVDSEATLITSTTLGGEAPLIGAAAAWRCRFQGASQT